MNGTLYELSETARVLEKQGDHHASLLVYKAIAIGACRILSDFPADIGDLGEFPVEAERAEASVIGVVLRHVKSELRD